MVLYKNRANRMGEKTKEDCLNGLKRRIDEIGGEEQSSDE